MPPATPVSNDDAITLMKLDELASRLRISTRTIMTLVARGDMPAISIPGTKSLRFCKSDIAAWLATGRRSQPSTRAIEVQRRLKPRRAA